eukprot:1144581-Pelagomonas_calceolata.AAC.1
MDGLRSSPRGWVALAQRAVCCQVNEMCTTLISHDTLLLLNHRSGYKTQLPVACSSSGQLAI